MSDGDDSLGTLHVLFLGKRAVIVFVCVRSWLEHEHYSVLHTAFIKVSRKGRRKKSRHKQITRRLKEAANYSDEEKLRENRTSVSVPSLPLICFCLMSKSLALFPLDDVQ